ncbi:2-succinyl-5-enolpyruvyl-6-hydroxy-3-cyclohexene-1-carboxylic-acid synthase [Leucobacter aridicollis]|uniref:2-succinyl-5-enolpyruvyl-6-hydroxy-3-cyclohexene-1-carboxylate synthase n=1 Tax=Leucobacter aridicollis TaxID=283878 RepID=A0A852R461_9MICO|nr:2-succinyl-5-enolpyruvyl-6-hydroxy-3-cyclohexene-1-carboxylic-acid synthase [Leucobacter aridicollis]MBL3683434.1 2-succinyl-5-enolpyruvyl-6-hydroxy-3-cyclohexene-1-carboxylic-acid synthase [Leucobacter aridicollis]NYD25259.1 2-succinyl-5-enolpyruvyl-6-hydroxy-3-cyclohexene-1-carboxylate synthase [Leucobacter aridicollis]
MTGPAPASIFAVELLAGLIRRGVSDVVVCPGSRSQALALAAAAAESAGAIRLHVRVDERSAAFFALGLARETGLPAPVIVTSGTAVANLAPAAYEAHEGRVPFIALTADRPATMRGTRSNQTTSQLDMFGAAARLSLDVEPPEFGPEGEFGRSPNTDPDRLAARALSAAVGSRNDAPAGPVQLNLQFVEPLSGTAGFEQMIAAGFTAAGAEGADARAALLEAPGTRAGGEAAGAPRAGLPDPDPATTSGYVHDDDALTVVIAGAGAGDTAEEFARAAGLPLLAEVVSGSRFGREAITAYATLIDDPEIGGLVERAVVFGHPTLTRQIPALLKRDDVEVIVVDPHTGDHYAPAPGVRVTPTATVSADHDPRAHRRWLGAWVTADRALQQARSTVHEPDLEAARETGYKERNAYARAEVAVKKEPITRELLVESVWRATWPHDRLVIAASRLVRVLDGLAPARKLAVHANRGLAGIDGTVATAHGIAVASQTDPDPARSAGTTRVIIGDLAMLHDAGSLLLPEAPELRPRIQLIVGNDGGGTIFDGLEVAGTTPAPDFERVMRTPRKADLRALAEAYGWEYARVETRGDLERLLTTPVTGPTLVEAPLA